jgi:hypothetical protein
MFIWKLASVSFPELKLAESAARVVDRSAVQIFDRLADLSLARQASLLTSFDQTLNYHHMMSTFEVRYLHQQLMQNPR